MTSTNAIPQTPRGPVPAFLGEPAPVGEAATGVADAGDGASFVEVLSAPGAALSGPTTKQDNAAAALTAAQQAVKTIEAGLRMRGAPLPTANGVVSPAGVVADYYSSVKLAAQLTKDADVHGAIARVLRVVSMPPKAEAVLAEAAGLPKVIVPDARDAEPITLAEDPATQVTSVDQLKDLWRAHDDRGFALSDTTLLRLWRDRNGKPMRDLLTDPVVIRGLDRPHIVAAMAVLARSAHLGLLRESPAWVATLNMLLDRLPTAGAEAIPGAQAVASLARAVGYPTDSLRLGAGLYAPTPIDILVSTKTRDAIAAVTEKLASVLAPSSDAEDGAVVVADVVNQRKQLQAASDELAQIVSDARAAGEDPGLVAELAISALYDTETLAKHPLGTVPRESEVTTDRKRPLAPGRTSAFNVSMPKNRARLRDKRLIPDAAKSRMTNNPTTDEAGGRAARAWGANKAFILMGTTGTGKTSLVRELCAITETPFVRVQCNPEMDERELIGRWVGEEQKYTEAFLQEMDPETLRIVAANDYGLYDDDASIEDAIAHILDCQKHPRYVYGLITKAMMSGACIVLDEGNLLRASVLAKINSITDMRGSITIDDGPSNVVVKRDPNFRMVMTANPPGYIGREDLKVDVLSRWQMIDLPALTNDDIMMVLRDKGMLESIPAPQLASLLSAHASFSLAAMDPKSPLGANSGGLDFSIRNVMRVANRFIGLRGLAGVSDDDLMRRELQEIYVDCLIDPADRDRGLKILDTAAPQGDRALYRGSEYRYDNISVVLDDFGYQAGDVYINKLGIDHPQVPGKEAELLLTPRMREYVYKVSKQIHFGENPLLIGDSGVGKTAIPIFIGMLREQPVYSLQMSKQMDMRKLIGRFTPNGWVDGITLQAARPENNAPGIVIFDEYAVADPKVRERNNSMWDDDRMIVIAERGGEVVRLDPDFIGVAATNPNTDKYGDRTDLSPAEMNRFTVTWVRDFDGWDEMYDVATLAAAKARVPESDVPLETIVATLVDVHVWYRYMFADLTKEDLQARPPEELLRIAAYVGADPKSVPTVSEAVELIFKARKELEDKLRYVNGPDGKLIKLARASNDEQKFDTTFRRIEHVLQAYAAYVEEEGPDEAFIGAIDLVYAAQTRNREVAKVVLDMLDTITHNPVPRYAQ